MAKFLELLLAAPEVKPLLSSEHFSVDGTLLRAWASHSPTARRSRSMALTTGRRHPVVAMVLVVLQPLARSAPKATSAAYCSPLHKRRRGQAVQIQKAPGVSAFLSFVGHYVFENNKGLVVASEVIQATGKVEPNAALRMARSLCGTY